MTNPRAAAVEAAVRVFGDDGPAFYEDDPTPALVEAVEAAITAYLARMAEAGWVMVRDVGEIWEPLQKTEVEFAKRRWGSAKVARAEGWNACRAAMLGGDAPPRADGEG